jgi:hypothetical protein
MIYPHIQVHIPTYARSHLLGEALESVRRQTYQGPVSVLIVNDCPWQEIEAATDRSWPPQRGMQVINLPERLPSLGAKRHHMLEMAPDESWIAFLDDDDLWMPWYLEQSMARARDTWADVVFSSTVFYHRHDLWTYEDIPGGIPMLVRASAAKVAGFPLCCSCGEDNLFRERLAEVPGILAVKNTYPGYVVRAGGGHLHASMASSTKFMLSAESDRDAGKAPQGVVKVAPGWKNPYDEILAEKFPEVAGKWA